MSGMGPVGTGRSSRAHPGGPPLASLALAAVAIALGPVAIGAAAGAAGGVASREVVEVRATDRVGDHGRGAIV